MKNRTFFRQIILFVLFAFLGGTISSQVPSFEYLSLTEEEQTAFFTFENSMGNFIISNVKGGGASEIIELDENGELSNSLILEREEGFLQIFNIFEGENFYHCLGTTSNFETDSSYFYYGKVSYDLELLNEHTFFLDESWAYRMNCKKIENDSFFCIGIQDLAQGAPIVPYNIGYKAGENVADIYVEEEYLDIITGSIKKPHIESELYLRGQQYLRKVNESMELLEDIPIPFQLRQEGDIRPFNDSTFIISGKKTIDNFPNEPSSFREIGLGLVSYDFEEGNFVTFGKTNDTVDFPAFLRSIDIVEDNKVYCGGTANYIPSPPVLQHVPSWFVLSQFDENLSPLWEKYYGGDAYYVMYGLDATSDNGCLMYGFKHDYRNEPDIAQLYILKVDTEGNITSSTTIPYFENKFKIYPNPFSERIQIETDFDFTRSGLLLEVSDESGRVLLSKSISGEGESINTRHLSEGTYFCTLRDKYGRVVKSRKVMKLGG